MPVWKKDSYRMLGQVAQMGVFDFGFFRERKKEKIRKEARTRFKDIDVLESRKGNYEKFRDKLLDSSTIMLIIGKRGSGKTSLGMKMLELFHYKTTGTRQCYVVGYSRTRLPKWMKKIDKVDDAPENSVVLLDEGAIGYFSRDSMKQANKMLSKMMTIARHKNLTLIIITQNCMLPSTKILTEKGVKEIKDVIDGEKVFSYSVKKEKIELKKAIRSGTLKRKLVIIETEDGDKIECSPDHKLLVKNRDGIIKKPAKDLTEDDELLKPMYDK